MILNWINFINESLILEDRMSFSSGFYQILNTVYADGDVKSKKIAGHLIDISEQNIDDNIPFNNIDINRDRSDFVYFISDSKLDINSYLYTLDFNYRDWVFYNIGDLDISDDDIEDYISNSTKIKYPLKLVETYDKNSFTDLNYTGPNNRYLEYPIYKFKDNDNRVFLIQNNGVVKNLKEDVDVNKSEMRIGRFIRAILQKFKKEFTDSDIESFVNTYKSILDFDKSKFDLFEIIKGRDIKKYYNEKTYLNQKGSLGASCMKYDRCQKYLNIYCDNEDVCSLLILKDIDDKSKIIGRSLIWETSIGKFMDRIYYIKDSDVNLFTKYAKDNNMYFKASSNYNAEQKITIQLKNFEFKYYPYMDTFKYLALDGELSNIVNIVNTKKEFYFLEQTFGGHNSTLGDVCTDCLGSEEVECYDCDGDGRNSIGRICPNCSGHGYIPCSYC
jgi:hypothetical protein